MPGARKMILKHVMTGICTKMNRNKQLPQDLMDTPLNRCLNTFDITLLGIGHMVGAGIYVLTGTVAREIAGPGIIISFLLAGVASLLAALCYAEFGTRVPKAGSAYVYTYVSVGEFWAFVIGWNIILEHIVGAASVARAWSGYLDALVGGYISNTTILITGEMHEKLLARYPDVLAFLVCITYALLLGIGVKASSVVNSFLTIINLGVMLLITGIGFYYADEENWTSGPGGFLPFGFGGVIAGAATCFYAFVGFDSIATSGEEARNPSFSIPMATVLSMGIVTVGYVLVSAALTLVTPYWSLNPTAAIPEAFSSINMHWVKYVVSVGAICGMTTSLFGSLFSLPRCMYAMANDGLLFSFLGNVNEKTQVPLTNLIISGLFSAIIALIFDLEKLVEFMSIGTLLAYTIVSASVIILRYRPPTIESRTVLTPGSDNSMSISEATTPASEIPCLGGTLRAQYGWLEPIFGRFEPGSAVTGCVIVYAVFGSALCVLMQIATRDYKHGIWWTVVLASCFILVMAACMLVIVAHHQNTTGMAFRVPMVPFIPALSILCNIEFMVHLNILTWLRFLVWMIVGKYVPAVSYTIHRMNQRAKQKINLAGLAIGNGLSDPEHQLKHGEYLYQLGLIDTNTLNTFIDYQSRAVNYIRSKQFTQAFRLFDDLLNGDLNNHTSIFKNATGFTNYFNYLQANSDPVNDNAMGSFIQRFDVRKALHVGNCSFHVEDETVETLLIPDMMDSVAPWVSELLSYYRVLIYNGQLDIIVAYPLTENYLKNLNFKGAQQYKTAARHIWKVDGDIAGFVKQAGLLTEVLVRNAGHMVPADQPKWAMDLINRFTRNKPFY